MLDFLEILWLKAPTREDRGINSICARACRCVCVCVCVCAQMHAKMELTGKVTL